MFIFRDLVLKKKDLPKIEQCKPGDAYLVISNHHMYTPALKEGKVIWFDLGRFPPKGPERKLR